MLALALSAALVGHIDDPVAPTRVADVIVVGSYFDYRLRVNLAGADSASDLVVSADPAMNCGDQRFDTTPGPYRQCWLRGRRNTPIILTAQQTGVFGRDWTVDWIGCQPLDDGRSCTVAISGEMEVGATFRAL